jgi:hypothetical protein
MAWPGVRVRLLTALWLPCFLQQCYDLVACCTVHILTGQLSMSAAGFLGWVILFSTCLPCPACCATDILTSLVHQALLTGTKHCHQFCSAQLAPCLSVPHTLLHAMHPAAVSYIGVLPSLLTPPLASCLLAEQVSCRADGRHVLSRLNFGFGMMTLLVCPASRVLACLLGPIHTSPSVLAAPAVWGNHHTV